MNRLGALIGAFGMAGAAALLAVLWIIETPWRVTAWIKHRIGWGKRAG